MRSLRKLTEKLMQLAGEMRAARSEPQVGLDGTVTLRGSSDDPRVRGLLNEMRALHADQPRDVEHIMRTFGLVVCSS